LNKPRELLTVHSIAEIRALVRGFQRDGLRVGFVPTMGNLHAGHYALVELAREHADRVVASVFVNPSQFGPLEDYSRYPRTLAADQAGLLTSGCDVLFAPSVEEMYGVPQSAEVVVPDLVDILCGAFRPGHFQGVATVVAKLFNIVGADVAVFGRKDYQQFIVIQQMVAALNMPIEIVGAPTCRDHDGLAMSSRNQYLNATERQVAPMIYQTLLAIARRFGDGESVTSLEAYGVAQLTQVGFTVDYVSIRNAQDLSAPLADQPGIVLIAARLGSTRLIDNQPLGSGAAVAP